jgi:3-phenylpropionate/trans-cinnamate dioxygenase ferredoxin component
VTALVDVAGLGELPPGHALRVDVGDTPVCLVNVDGEVHAVHDVCTHALESLSGGWIEGDRIECPRHGAFFSVVTGEALTPPATRPLPTFRAVVEGERILLDPTPSHPHPIL